MLLCAFAFMFWLFREKEALVHGRSALCTFKGEHIVAMATARMNSYHESKLCRLNP